MGQTPMNSKAVQKLLIVQFSLSAFFVKINHIIPISIVYFIHRR